jgi:hypothetical protein
MAAQARLACAGAQIEFGIVKRILEQATVHSVRVAGRLPTFVSSPVAIAAYLSTDRRFQRSSVCCGALPGRRLPHRLGRQREH